jgi:hypothetical protein
MSKQTWTSEPCKRCGQTPRGDYAGYCRDCADVLVLRGLLAPFAGQSIDETQQETETESSTEDKVP